MKASFLFLLIFSAASNSAAAEAPGRGAAVTASMNCTAFKWASIGEHQRGAMLVPLTLNGKTFDFQLDTGADLSSISEKVAVEAGLMKAGEGGARVEDVRLGGASVGPRWLMTRDSVGTIGLDMLVGYTTVIDYPAQRLCVTPTADLPYAIYKNTGWTDAILRHGKLFVPIQLDGQQRADFFFDTGASLFPLSVDLAEWKALTGKAAPSATDQRISGNAWGTNVELVGASSLRPIAIGPLPANRLTVFHNAARPERYSKYPFPAAGLFGNAGLWDHIVILSLSSRPQFGVVKENRTP